ncbi:phosphoribosylformylglycinamidine synthase subunit PurL [Candidatus Woesearchaeota archaeon]|nr:phosphoribosylformylglycinamidine synthase subunit PurL [Candidatus Woesearchaeota archaeon]
MGDVDTDLIDIKGMEDANLSAFLRKNAISLTISEAKKIVELIGRNPSLTELHMFNIQWSEHSSYKSSRHILKMLPTKSSNVILGPIEDSGIVELGYIDGERYGIVVSHESHNHPSQVVPYEGAATGVGGIIRDVLCMGAKVIATADPLRFGNPYGENKNKARYIANEVINGIAGYGNAVGIPNLAGDIYFNESFDDNCLVNVVCLGILKEKDIIHSYAPKNAEGYDIIIVGKPTDNSGFGGAAFASLILDEEAKENNRGAVQVPDPFLKNVLIRATYKVFEEAKKKKIALGFKDMGAGGIMCSTSELCSDADYGAEINLDKVHVSMKNLLPFVILCSETQERFTWISPKEFTPTLLRIYNEDFALSTIAENARATVIGNVTKKQDYVVKHQGKVVCNVPIKAVTNGISYERQLKKPIRDFKEPQLKEPLNHDNYNNYYSYNKIALKILSHPNVASKQKCYKHYDRNVMGNTIIESGFADAGLIRAMPNSKYGIALSVDSNPRYCRINPYLGAVNAVAESMRNVAAIGAVPSALTDCLNYGNPEKPEQFYDFAEGVRGIKDAAENIYLRGTKEPVPVISGNVSLYNESSKGKAIDPSPVIACIGVMRDYEKAITIKIKKANSLLFLAGKRKDELGGSIYYEINKELGKNAPLIDFEEQRNIIYAVIECIENGLLLSCHDISDGGLLTAIAEMILGGNADGIIGAEIDLCFSNLRDDKTLFSESPGFVFEAEEKNTGKIKAVFKKYNLEITSLGITSANGFLLIKNKDKKIIDLPINKLREAWTSGFPDAIK